MISTQRPSRTRSGTQATAGGTKAAPVCCACGQPVRAGEPHWAGDADNRAWHYGCAERAGFTLSWARLRQRSASEAAG